MSRDFDLDNDTANVVDDWGDDYETDAPDLIGDFEDLVDRACNAED